MSEPPGPAPRVYSRLQALQPEVPPARFAQLYHAAERLHKVGVLGRDAVVRPRVLWRNLRHPHAGVASKG
jgi:hypothetical protein